MSSAINSNTSQVESLVGRVADALASAHAPAVNAYELAKQVFLLTAGSAEFAPQAVHHSVIEALLRARLVTPLGQVARQKAFMIFGRSGASAAEVVCSLDPFAHISHLSAMEHHGLTDRFSAILYMTRPQPTEWRKQAQVRMAKDLGDHLLAYQDSGLPRLVPMKIEKVGQTVVQFCERSQLGAFRLVAGSALRVATIGRVFLDMLREPDLCGGMQHVIDVYQTEAKRYLKLIVDEVDRHGQPIDKVRAGYLLTEVCRQDDPVISAWQKFAQRGGSRKLDPNGEYSPDFSPKWQLSVNVPSLTKPIGGGYD
jgi:predicted transcriptional regulator of viral defense system